VPCGRPEEFPAAPSRSLKRGVAVGLALLGLALAAPSALAAPLVEVPPVTPSPSSLPAVPQPSVPPVKVVPSPPSQPQVQVPRGAAPVSPPSLSLPPTGSDKATSGSGPGAVPPAVRGVGGGADPAGTVTDAVTEARQSAAGATHLGSRTRSGRLGERSVTPVVDGDAPPSIGPAVAAPLRRWLAYVWPAIALGPFGEVLATQFEQLRRAISLPGDGLAQALSPLIGVAGASGSSPSAMPAPRSSAPSSAPFGLLPGSGGMNLLVTVVTVLAALVGVVALARLMVGADLFSSRWLH
jgi:hypothetical protein